MYRAGQTEIDAVGQVIRSHAFFRYREKSECERFEKRWAKHLGAGHACITSSGSTALTAALAGLGVGPGQEVIVPAYTYMATAIAVLAVGAIPVIVDVDESLTMSPLALAEAIGPRTKAVIPVHMVGLPCDMGKIMRIARKRKLWVIEDACQAVGGGYEGKMLGAIGDAGTFSFNAFKNITCGEGGAVVSSDEQVAQRARCMTDCCGFYWRGRSEDTKAFVAAGARASEIQGAMLNVQLDRLPGMLRAMRGQKKTLLRKTAKSGLAPSPCHSLDYECGTQVGYLLGSQGAAVKFGAMAGGFIPGKTGRHVYTEWDPILEKHGAHHPAMDPFKMPANRRCRMKYSKDMCPRSLDVLNRTVLVPTHPDRTPEAVDGLIVKIKEAAKAVL